VIDADGHSLPGMILRGAEANDRALLVFATPDGVDTTTVGNVVEQAGRVAGALQGLGVRPGDVVAVQLPGNRDGSVAQAAIAMCGAVLLPIVMIYQARELTFILRESGAVALIVPTQYRGADQLAIVRSLGAVPSLRTVIAAGPGLPEDVVDFADLSGGLSKPLRLPRPDPSDRALLVYTSGTTGDPKGVQHSHRTLAAELTSPTPEHGDATNPAQLAMFPPGHVAGLLGLMRVLVSGLPTVVLETWSPARAAGLIDEYAITGGVGAPVQLVGLLDQLERGLARLDSLNGFRCGAAAVSPSLIERADSLGIAAFRCYGSSEHPTVTTGYPDDSLVKRATTDGRVIAGNEVRVLDDAGRDVAIGQDGEIVTRGRELFIGYTDPRLDAAAFLPGGWYRSGDVGNLDADGFMTITDRKKDIVIRGGENISSKEVEDILSTHPAVADVAVIGSPDDVLGERVCAVIVVREGRTIDLDEVRAHFADAGAARPKTPESLVFVAELPRTPAGKVQKHVLREQVSPRR